MILEVIKQGDISIIKPVFTRDKEFEQFAIRINGEGIQELVEDWIKTPEKAKRKGKRTTSPAEVSREDHRKVLEIFMLNADGRAIWVNRKDMVTNLIANFLNAGISFGQSKAREYMKYYEQENMIVKTQRLIRTEKVDHYALVTKPKT